MTIIQPNWVQNIELFGHGKNKLNVSEKKAEAMRQEIATALTQLIRDSFPDVKSSFHVHIDKMRVTIQPNKRGLPPLHLEDPAFMLLQRVNHIYAAPSSHNEEEEHPSDLSDEDFTTLVDLSKQLDLEEDSDQVSDEVAEIVEALPQLIQDEIYDQTAQLVKPLNLDEDDPQAFGKALFLGTHPDHTIYHADRSLAIQYALLNILAIDFTCCGDTQTLLKRFDALRVADREHVFKLMIQDNQTLTLESAEEEFKTKLSNKKRSQLLLKTYQESLAAFYHNLINYHNQL